MIFHQAQTGQTPQLCGCTQNTELNLSHVKAVGAERASALYE